MLFNKLKKIKTELYVFGLFVLSRLPSLGYDMFTTDVWKWKQRIYDFGTGVFTLDFAKTIQRYHPGVSLMWIGSLSVKVFNFTYRLFTGSNPPDNNTAALFHLHFTQKLFIVIVLGIVLALIFHLLKKMFGLKYAAIAIVLLSLEPFYVALTRVVHLEGLQATFMIASFVTMFYYVSTDKARKWLFLSSLLAALALLTKTSAIFVVPFAGLLLFGYKLTESKKFLRSLGWSLGQFFIWLIGVTLFIFILWPALWTHSELVFKTIQKGINVGVDGGHLQMFKGEWVEDPGSAFYGYVFVLRSSLYLVAGLIGSIFVFKIQDTKKKKFLIFALLYALLYFVEITIPSKKLDRYFLPSMVSLTFVAAVFFEWLVSYVSQRINKTFLISALIVFIPSLVTLGLIHPDYFSYYSILGGGLEKSIWTIEPKWIVGQHELTKYLENHMIENNLPSFQEGESLHHAFDDLSKRLVVAFPEKYYTQLHPFVRRVGGWAVISSIHVEAKNAELIIFPVWFDDTDEKDPWSFKENIYLRGVPIYNVYTNDSRFDWE